MNRPVPVQTDPMFPSTALVMNVANGRGVELVRALAEAGVGVAIHFIANRQAVVSLVADIWDQGGRVCALDGREAGPADREALLGEARRTLGDVQMVVDASSKPAFRTRRPAARSPERRPLAGICARLRDLDRQTFW